MRRKFSVLAEGRHIFGRRPKPRAETALEKSLAPREIWARNGHLHKSVLYGKLRTAKSLTNHKRRNTPENRQPRMQATKVVLRIEAFILKPVSTRALRHPIIFENFTDFCSLYGQVSYSRLVSPTFCSLVGSCPSEGTF